jgi:pyruvate kinase
MPMTADNYFPADGKRSLQNSYPSEVRSRTGGCEELFSRRALTTKVESNTKIENSATGTRHYEVFFNARLRTSGRHNDCICQGYKDATVMYENANKNPGAGECLTQSFQALSKIRGDMLRMESCFSEQIASLADAHRDGAKNLLHYLALRRHDIRPLQEKLALFGLSSLGRCESRVLANLDAVLNVTDRLIGKHSSSFGPADFTLGRSDLEQNSAALLGPKPANRDVRIMVTMPSAAATDYRLVSDLVASGMDCMRINCAHDDQDAWAAMVEHLRRAQREHSRACRVIMDLPGPKLRTGPIEPMPGVAKWKPRRDRYGRVTAPARIWLTPLEHPEPACAAVDACLTLPGNWLARLRSGDRITFTDARDAWRAIEVTQAFGANYLAESSQTSYLTSETTLSVVRLRDLTRIGALPPVEPAIVLRPGEILVLTMADRPGRAALRSTSGDILEPATIGVTLPQVIADAHAGEAIWFDDGKIGGVIRSVAPDEMKVEIVQARAKGANLRSDKGINLPDTNLNLPALTAEDIAILPFITRHADLVDYSFVRSTRDVELLLTELARVRGNDLGIVLKIETRKAFERLPSLILTAMRHPRVGVMIARGDLAVECGYERTGELQEEIMWIAEAAHLPVIWATQVLETLAKKGHPSRAEITDAAMAERTECVMLNKGPYVVEAVRMLDNVLRRMQHHQAKKAALLRPLNLAERFYQDAHFEQLNDGNPPDRLSGRALVAP